MIKKLRSLVRPSSDSLSCESHIPLNKIKAHKYPLTLQKTLFACRQKQLSTKHYARRLKMNTYHYI